MKKYVKFLVNKIGGAGLMMSYQELLAWVRYITKDIDPSTQVIIVVSALAKTTRMLQEVFNEKLQGENKKALQVFENIKKIHLQRCTDLFIGDTAFLDGYFSEIKRFILESSIDENNRTISNAYILKFGELMSSAIFHQFLLRMNSSVKLIDAQEMIYASGKDYCNSIPLQPKTSENITRIISKESDYQIIITQGYICNERLLGLDGSDLTASLIALSLMLIYINSYVRLTFWKDILGVMINGIVQEKMNQNEYDSLPTVPVRKDAIITSVSNKIETWIRSFENLEHPGTKIAG